MYKLWNNLYIFIIAFYLYLSAIRGVQNWQNRIWMTLKEFIKMREHSSLQKLQIAATDPKYIKDDEFMFDSRNYFLKTVTFNIIKSQQISVAISRMQGLTNRSANQIKFLIIKYSISYNKL